MFAGKRREGFVGNFSAVYVKVEGAEETDLGFHHLAADTLEAALEEAPVCAPQGTNSIKICREGLVERRVMVDF
jgi:hypothetical protein